MAGSSLNEPIFVSDEEEHYAFDLTDDIDDVEADAGVLARGHAGFTSRPRAAPPPLGYDFAKSTTIPFGPTIAGGIDVELVGHGVLRNGDPDGDLLRIRHIMVPRNGGEILLRGILFRRVVRMDQMLRFIPGDLCAVLMDVDPSISDPALDDYLVDVPLTSVWAVRRVVLTNVPFAGGLVEDEKESLSSGTKVLKTRKWHDHSYRDEVSSEDGGVLCCRWKRIQHDGDQGRKGCSGGLIMLRQHETDPGKGLPDAALIYWKRELEAQGRAPCGQASLALLPDGATLDLTADDDGGVARIKNAAAVSRTVERTSFEDQRTTLIDVFGNQTTHVRKSSTSKTTFDSHFTQPLPSRSRKRKFSTPDPMISALMNEPRTYSDICAGAGGVAEAAKQTGFKAKMLLEKEKIVCRTLRLAFPRAKIVQEDLGDFLQRPHGQSCKVVVVHVSFPCQPYSPANTARGGGKNKPAYLATACSVGPIFRTTRPRVATFEQTSGMVTHSKNYEYWRQLVRDITFEHYSLRWQILDASEHGTASKRKRLFVLAACPGHPVPCFPPPRAGRKLTINDVLAQVGEIEDDWMRLCTRRTGQPLDGNKQLYTITCGSHKRDVHPDGGRSFNMKELAMLAGFPRDYKFAKAGITDLRRQIGNAVPVELAKDVYSKVNEALDVGREEMRKWLSKDGLLGPAEVGAKDQQAQRAPLMKHGKEIIVLDDGEPARRKKTKVQESGKRKRAQEKEIEVVVLDENEASKRKKTKIDHSHVVRVDDDVVMID